MTEISGLSVYQQWQKDLFNSGIIGALTHGELKFLYSLEVHLRYKTFFCYPGKRRIQDKTKLKREYQDRIAYTLAKIGLISGRKKVTIKGGSTWGYWVNPDVPFITEQEIKRIRREVVPLEGTTKGKARWSPSNPEVVPFWGRGGPPVVLKSVTKLKNTKEQGVAQQPKKTKEDPLLRELIERYPEYEKETKQEWKEYIDQRKNKDTAYETIKYQCEQRRKFEEKEQEKEEIVK